MKGAKNTLRGTVAVGLQGLLWVWLVALSILVGIGYRAMTGLAEQAHVDSGLRQVQVLEARIVELAERVQMLDAQPESATVASLYETRQHLDARLTRMEQALADRSDAEALRALHTEVEQLKIRSQPAPAVPPPPTKPVTSVAATARQSPFPFRVVGSEMRAGQRSVSVAPVKGELTADKIQVVLPGEAVGQWRLQAIEANTAVFQNGKQTRRLVIP
ncbi:hypothetical protein [Nitrosomonas eutropha]|uniref:Secreted protein n=2 Tax=Nitrosomonas eutropha TaxID=916 RepID=A0ABX5MCA4_9PROT|nr:hypothetical protein [Nitrosomonas eutropha]ABI58390.1 conserved hypothetical protein [Nitrosomonas eutropha C91]PXV84214.1 hypothetical protein C8R14_10196 [Nitrosomonas eutropha]